MIDLGCTYEYRTQQYHIKKNHELYKLLDELTFKSKNLYNKALYVQRQCYFEHGRFISYFDLYKLLKNEEEYKALPNDISAQVLKNVTDICMSFMRAMKQYNKTPERFNGKPKLPRYKDKITGRFKLTFRTGTYSRLKTNKETGKNEVHFHYLLKGFTVETYFDEIVDVTISPKHNRFVVNINGIKKIYSPKPLESAKSAGIDLGIDNFATITVWDETTQPLIINGKGLKSYNKNFNKKLAALRSQAETRHGLYITNRIKNLYQKRNNYMQTWMHKASKRTVEYLVENGVTHLVIGKNKGWKQNINLGKVTNQAFTQIPFETYINYVTYKAQEQGITVYTVEESYTSGTSFLDNELPIEENYDKSRRKHRGLFVSTETGTKINADVNASYQIQKKVFPQLSLTSSRFSSSSKQHNKTVPQRINVS